MGLKMSDEIDTDMIEEALIVIDQACVEFKKTVFMRATREMDWQARHKADDVIVFILNGQCSRLCRFLGFVSFAKAT